MNFLQLSILRKANPLFIYREMAASKAKSLSSISNSISTASAVPKIALKMDFSNFK